MTGKVLADLQCYRGNCTRATGSVDSIFTRGYRHTGTMRLDLTGQQARRIPLMRPACQDGVIVSCGMLYWGPWMCDCNHSLVGMIGLAPAGSFQFNQDATEADRLEHMTDRAGRQTTALKSTTPTIVTAPGDWPGYRMDSSRHSATQAKVSASGDVLWQVDLPGDSEPTAPVIAEGLTFWSGLDGIVHAADLQTGRARWTAFTGGAVRFPPEYWAGRIYVGSSDGWVYCFQAKDGTQLWRFRAAPAERRILVHGKILSNWPVGGGVLVHDGVVFAAAGITSYDGTHVYALDASTGKIRWQNNSSGRLVDEQQVTGVSVQGHLLLHDDKLFLAGGNVVSPAIYDIQTGKCLNQLNNEWWDQPEGSSQRFPSKPTKEMFRRSPRGRELFVVDGQVRVFDQLLYSPPKYGPSRYFGGNFLQAAHKSTVIRATSGRVVRLANKKNPNEKPLGVWQNDLFREPRALAITDNAVVVTGELSGSSDATGTYAVMAFDATSGRPMWKQTLPAAPVNWGLAISRDGHVLITLVDGRVVCLGAPLHVN